MIMIEVEDNPNCRGYPQMIYSELEPQHEVVKVRTERNGKVEDCWATGVEEGGAFVPLYAQKVTDSGAGTAYLVFGALWGIRLQKEDPAEKPWNLEDSSQWGESYLMLDSENDLTFK